MVVVINDTYSLDELPGLDERLLLLDLIGRDPRLDLVAVPLQLLDLLLEVGLVLFSLVVGGGIVDLLERLAELLDALGDLFQNTIDLAWRVKVRECESERLHAGSTAKEGVL